MIWGGRKGGGWGARGAYHDNLDMLGQAGTMRVGPTRGFLPPRMLSVVNLRNSPRSSFSEGRKAFTRYWECHCDLNECRITFHAACEGGAPACPEPP